MVLEFNASRSALDVYLASRYELARRRPNIAPGGVTLIHLLPLGRLDALLDLTPHTAELGQTGFVLGGGFDQRFNFDGYFVHMTEPSGTRPIHTFTQWLRCGGVEVLTTRLHATAPNGQPPFFRTNALASLLYERVPRFLRTLVQTVGVDPPFVLYLHIQDMLGLHIVDNNGLWSAQAVDRAILDVGPVLFDEPLADHTQRLKEFLDVIWQSAGYDGAPAQAKPGRSLRSPLESRPLLLWPRLEQPYRSTQLFQPARLRRERHL